VSKAELDKATETVTNLTAAFTEVTAGIAILLAESQRIADEMKTAQKNIGDGQRRAAQG